MILKIIGAIFVFFGLFDFISSIRGFDVWLEWFGISIPGIWWYTTAFIETGVGYFIFDLGNAKQIKE